MYGNEIQRSYARYAETANDIVKVIAEISVMPLVAIEQPYLERHEAIARDALYRNMFMLKV